MNNLSPLPAAVLTGISQCLAQGDYAASIAAEQDIAWLLNHIDALTDRLAERDATVAALEKRLAKYEGHLKKITITMQRDELTLEQEELRDELFMEMLEAFWTTDDGSAWLDQLEAAKHTPGSDASEGGAE